MKIYCDKPPVPTAQDKLVYTIDGSRFSTLHEFWDEISTVLIPGVYWGENLNAFNDILRGGFGTPDEGFILCWENHQLSKERLGYDETVRILEHTLTTCHPTAIDIVQESLDKARQHIGQTIFDELLEIIREHGPGGREEDSFVDLVLA